MLDRLHRRDAELPHLPGLHRTAGRPAGPERESRRIRRARRLGPALQDQQIDALRPQKLFLRRPSQGVSDHRILRAARRKRLPDHRRRRRPAPPHRHHAASSRRRRRQTRSRRRRRTDRRLQSVFRRLQPRRRAARRSGVRTRHRFAARSPRVRVGHAPAGALSGHFRRRHGKRIHARRREHLAESFRRALGQPRRSQKHELPQGAGTRARV